MYRKQSFGSKIDGFLESVFWISYMLIILLTPVIAASIFVGGLFVTFAT